MENFVKKIIDENTSFVFGKLNNNTKNEFFSCKERHLLQGIIGIVDESSEVSDAEDDLAELGEVGDVLFYLILSSNAVCAWGERNKLIDIIKKTAAREPSHKIKNIEKILSLGKKVCFQERVDLVERLCVLFGLLWQELILKYGEDGIELAIAMMRYKLNRRYRGGFSAKASEEREEKESDKN